MEKLSGAIIIVLCLVLLSCNIKSARLMGKWVDDLNTEEHMWLNFRPDSICEIGAGGAKTVYKYHQVADTIFFIQSPFNDDLVIHYIGDGRISFSPYHSHGNKLEKDVLLIFGCHFRRP